MLGRLKFIALLGIVIGPILAFMGWKEKGRLERIGAEGKTVQASIDGGSMRRGRRGSKTYSMDVTFTPEGGAPIHQTFKVKKAYVDQHITNSAISDPTAEVRYLPSDPKQAIVVGGSDDDTAMLPVGAIWAVIGLVVGAMSVIRRSAA